MDMRNYANKLLTDMAKAQITPPQKTVKHDFCPYCNGTGGSETQGYYSNTSDFLPCRHCEGSGYVLR